MMDIIENGIREYEHMALLFQNCAFPEECHCEEGDLRVASSRTQKTK